MVYAMKTCTPKSLLSSHNLKSLVFLMVSIILILQFTSADASPAGYRSRQVTRRVSMPRNRCYGKLRRVCEREARKCYVPSQASKRAVAEWMRSAAAEISLMERLRILSNSNSDDVRLSPILIQRFADLQRESELDSHLRQKPSCSRCQQLCWD